MTTKRRIIISKEDHLRLESLFLSKRAAILGDTPYLRALRCELSIAQIVAPEDIPPDVVTMNSTVRLREGGGREIETFTLVYPKDADIANGKLSILAPIGTAILGYRVGDVVQWQVPSGLVRIGIEEIVFQPERDGIAA